MTTTRATPVPTEVADFYAAHYARFVRDLTLAAGSRAEAEEAVQEAFIRLIGSWSRVSRYENPEAWLRKVAIGKVLNRRRHLRVASKHESAIAEPESEPPTDGIRVDLQRALRVLPRDQRVVLVMAYVMDLELEQIARDLSIPVGTVKSRLHRGKRQLAETLGQDFTDDL